jgi:CRP-like cAMP-binding protein
LKKIQEDQLLNKNRKTKVYKDNFVIIEEEIKIVEMGAGVVIGELAMMDPKAVRALSGMAKTDCIFLLLNRDSFDILVKVWIINKLTLNRRKRRSKWRR